MTPEQKRIRAAALEAEALIKRRAKAEQKSKQQQGVSPAPQSPPPPAGRLFHPQPPKRVRFTPTQICSQLSPEESAALLKKLEYPPEKKGNQ